MRRRRAALVLAALVALLLGVAIGALSDGGGDRPGATGHARPSPRSPTALARARADVARMPLERQVGQVLVVAFAGTSAPAYVLDALRDGRVAGVILFGGNAPSAASVHALTARLRRAAAGRAAPIVCLDQEGGAIRTLAFAPAAAGQAAQPTPAAARSAATATARALRRLGVNVVLGPVADVAAGTAGSAMASRAYPGDAAAVAASARAATAAYVREGVLPVAKHFPGLGGAIANTDDATVAVARTRAQLAFDLLPFRAAITAGGPLVMLGHARYPALDPTHIASQSRAVATGLLRDRLGFDGVAMTDSLEAEAVLASTGHDVGAAGVRSLAAGADLLLMTGAGSFPLVRDALAAQARRSPAFHGRLREAAARVLALRRTQLGRANASAPRRG